jgi:hypothetical protein
MYVYLNSEPGLYTVGFYKPNGQWEAESDHSSKEEAAARVNYLNGAKPCLCESVVSERCPVHCS